jgi:hypothetical protein
MRPSVDPCGSLFAGVWRPSQRARPTATCCAEAAQYLVRYGLWSEGLTLWMGLGGTCCGTGVEECRVGAIECIYHEDGHHAQKVSLVSFCNLHLCCVCDLDRQVFVM